MKKVLCLIDSLGPGGAQRQLVGLAVFLRERKYDVTVATYYDDRFYVDQLSDYEVPFVYIKHAQKGLLRQWYIMRFINRFKPDVLIAYLEAPSVRACVSHLFNRRFKLIVSERNTTQHVDWRERLRFLSFRLADFVVPNSFSQAAFINQSFPSLTNKVFTIPNFVDVQHFTPQPNRRRRNVPEILVVATIWRSKNTLGFIDAIAQMKEKGWLFHVSWYGKDKSNIEYCNQCLERIDNLGVNAFIELKDKTTHILEQYQSADYFCLPSFYEGTPNVICEAMACGLPVACSDVCDNSRYVVEDENGFLFNPNDSQSIVSALERMITLNENEYIFYCNNSRRRAESLFAKERFVESYINLIEG